MPSQCIVNVDKEFAVAFYDSGIIMGGNTVVMWFVIDGQICAAIQSFVGQSYDLHDHEIICSRVWL